MPRRVRRRGASFYLSWDAGILLVRRGRVLCPRLRSAGDPEVLEFEPGMLRLWLSCLESLRHLGAAA